jgi:hypothetical protein
VVCDGESALDSTPPPRVGTHTDGDSVTANGSEGQPNIGRCEYCKDEFQRKDEGQIYCSREHKRVARKAREEVEGKVFRARGDDESYVEAMRNSGGHF